MSQHLHQLLLFERPGIPVDLQPVDSRSRCDRELIKTWSQHLSSIFAKKYLQCFTDGDAAVTSQPGQGSNVDLLPIDIMTGDSYKVASLFIFCPIMCSSQSNQCCIYD